MNAATVGFFSPSFLNPQQYFRKYVYHRPLIKTAVCLVAWPLNECEAGVDLVLIETSLLFFC